MAKMLNSDALIDDYDEVHYLSSERFETLFAQAGLSEVEDSIIAIGT